MFVPAVEEKRVADGTLRGRWVDAVMRSPQITDAVRVALLAMAMDMDDAGRVSVKREDLALRLGKGKARITERVNAAVDAGFLERVLEGKRGQVAVYSAGFPHGSGYADPNARLGGEALGPDTRTQSEHFGSGLQTLTSAKSAEQGPDTRTQTVDYGSGYPDPLSSRGVEEGEDLQVVEGEGLFEIEGAASQPPPSKRKKRASTPKITIRADYAPTDELRAWAKARCPLVDIDLQTERFVLYFTRKGLKRPGWDQSWKSWMLQQQEWAQERQANVMQLRATGTNGYRPYQNVVDQSEYDKDYS